MIDMFMSIPFTKIRGDTNLGRYEKSQSQFEGNNWYVAPYVRTSTTFVSVDGYGQQAEYMRNGIDSLLQKNVKRILNETDNSYYYVY